jgi:hypothetical protein
MARVNFHLEGVGACSQELGWGVFRLGRAEDNHVVISHASVSSHHCELEISENQILIRDLGSTNGTFLNGQSVQSAVVPEEHTLVLGSVTVSIERPAAQVSVPQLTVKAEPKSVQFDDGTWSCEWHEAVSAQWQCPQCGGKFCSHCIRQLRLSGGRAHRFCPKCSTHIEPFTQSAKRPSTSVWSKVKNLLRGK